MKQRIGEYFCGAGGLSLGAILAAKEMQSRGHNFSIEPIWAVDSNEDACDTYKYNLVDRDIFIQNGAHETEVLCKDVRSIQPETLSNINGFLFGFPCNDFSIVGEQKGTNGEYGPLYLKAVDVLREKQPDWFVAENVSGLRSANAGQAYDEILTAFKNEGYEVVSHLYKFEEYGVPQTRHRYVVVGIKKELAERGVSFRIPKETTKDPQNYVTVREALANIPDTASNHEPRNITERVQARLAYIRPGQNAFNAEDIPENLQLNVKGAKLSNIYRKLDPDKPSYTLTANGGGGTHGYHWEGDPENLELNRPLTDRERARIQTFPDEFVFLGKTARSQVGMAVPPMGAYHIFLALFESLFNEK